MTLEQIFISISQRKSTCTATYIGVDPAMQDTIGYNEGLMNLWHLPAFETLLTEHGFTLVTDDVNLRTWTRKGSQLALGNPE